MRLTAPIRQIVFNQALETLKRSISKTISESTPHIQAAKENQLKILSQKFTDLNDWYMKLTGLDQVYLAQKKVTALQGQLYEIQEKRRDVGRKLSDVRQKSIELQDEIHKVKRQEDLEKYLDLMKAETEVLKMEKSISKTFQDYDQTERELFTAFTDSIRDSHEKQRAQMEYTKYFGIVLSITGSFLAFVYSSFRKEQLKQIIDERLQKFSDHSNYEKMLQEALVSRENIEETLKTVMKELKQHQSSNDQFQKNPALNYIDGTKEKYAKGYSYTQIFGIVFGIWLISKVLTG